MPLKGSFVIATWNRGPLLSALLEDLGRQEAPVHEVVVVDDGSSEPAAAALAGRRWGFSLKLLRQDNAGAAAARHRGILEATGEVIVILDDDMRVGPDFLAAHLRAHDSGADVVLGNICPAETLRTMPVFEKFHARQLARYAGAVREGREQASGARLCTGNVSFRRTHYFEVGGFDPALKRSEDRDLGIRFEQRGLRVVFQEEARSVHRSNHDDLGVWMRRAFLYGVYDRRIADKHPGLPAIDPWAFLSLVNPVSRPLLLAASLAPAAASVLSRVAIFASIALDRVGLTKLAIAGTTLTYGLEYFRGVAHESGSRAGALRGLLRHRRQARA